MKILIADRYERYIKDFVVEGLNHKSLDTSLKVVTVSEALGALIEILAKTRHITPSEVCEIAWGSRGAPDSYELDELDYISDDGGSSSHIDVRYIQ